MMHALIASLLAMLVLVPPARAGDGIETAGDVLQVVLPVTAATMTVGLRDWDGTIHFAKAFTLTMASTFTLKHSIDAERPNGSGLSMPSGHTAAAFSGASFIQRRYGWRYSLPAYGAAAFVAYSRVEAEKHHVEDVIVGALLGIGSTYLFTKHLDERIYILPLVGRGSYGFTVGMTW